MRMLACRRLDDAPAPTALRRLPTFIVLLAISFIGVATTSGDDAYLNYVHKAPEF